MNCTDLRVLVSIALKLATAGVVMYALAAGKDLSIPLLITWIAVLAVWDVIDVAQHIGGSRATKRESLDKGER